jgi:hypothetical protein
MQKSVSVKVVGAVLASLAATVVISTPSALAAAKAGGACKKSEVGTTATAGSANLECKASGKAGKWVRVTAPATTAAPVTTAAPAPATTPPATAAPTAAAPAVSAENGKGVTDSTIKIGFLDASFRDPDGFTPTSTGNTTALVGAIVEYINANGGIGGRKITPVIKQFNLSLSNVDQAAALCASFGDDEKVFALASQSVIVATASKECFAKKKVVYLEGGGSFPFDTKTIERMAPYAYQTNLPAIDRIGPSYAKMLLDEKFFGADPKGTKIGILSMGDDAYKAGVEALKAELKSG